MEAADHTVHLLPSFGLHLEYLQLLHPIDRLPVVVEDGCGIQGLRVHLVTVVPQPDDDRVGVEYDLHILHLFDITICLLDGERDEVVFIVPLKSRWDTVAMGVIASFVQREASCSGCIWGFLWVIRIFNDTYEWVLSWIEVSLAHTTGGAAPQAACCQCTDRRSASHAAILALLLATALANCSSLHIETTFLMASCVALCFPKRDW